MSLPYSSERAILFLMPLVCLPTVTTVSFSRRALFASPEPEPDVTSPSPPASETFLRFDAPPLPFATDFELLGVPPPIASPSQRRRERDTRRRSRSGVRSDRRTRRRVCRLDCLGRAPRRRRRHISLAERRRRDDDTRSGHPPRLFARMRKMQATFSRARSCILSKPRRATFRRFVVHKRSLTTFVTRRVRRRTSRAPHRRTLHARIQSQSSLCPLSLSFPTNCLYPNHSRSPGHVPTPSTSVSSNAQSW